MNNIKNLLLIVTATLLLMSFTNIDETKKSNQGSNYGLIIVDAQKWFIPGHPESMYEIWGIKNHNRTSDAIISSMDSVLSWANEKKLPVFVTYEGLDSGRYDLPTELLEDLDSSRTTHYVKFYYGAPKHKDFNKLIQKTGIDRWIIIGAETDVCVYQTAKELLKQGKQVTLVNEAIYSGRNNTEVSIHNLTTFGANFISLKELYTGTNLFLLSTPKVEAAIEYKNTILTVLPFSDTTNSNTSAAKRLEYLIQYAKIIHLKTESADSVSNTGKIRLLAGNITLENYKKLQTQTTDELIVISDCTPKLPFSEIPKDWHIHTLKTVFYELMETAAFYSKPIDELKGWQKELKKAMNENRLDYVESLQNL